jgi:hypothetical protein
VAFDPFRRPRVWLLELPGVQRDRDVDQVGRDMPVRGPRVLRQLGAGFPEERPVDGEVPDQQPQSAGCEGAAVQVEQVDPLPQQVNFQFLVELPEERREV